MQSQPHEHFMNRACNRQHIKGYRWLLCAALFLLSVTAHAETRGNTTVPIALGGKLGINVSYFGGDASAGYVNKVGLAAGFFGVIELHRMFAAQAELLYMSRGAEVEVNETNIGTIKVDYLDIPLLVSIRVPVGESIKPYVLLGPRFGVLLRAKVEDNEGNSADRTDQTTSLDVGVVLGAGARWTLTRQHGVCLELRYDLGFVSTEVSGEDLDVKNRAFTVMLGYQWALGAR